MINLCQAYDTLSVCHPYGTDAEARTALQLTFGITSLHVETLSFYFQNVSIREKSDDDKV